MIQLHDGEFVRVRVPGYLERSLTLALGAVHAPFFTAHEGAAIAVVLRREEWDRLAARFASAQVVAGFRLISIQPAQADPDFPSRLRDALAEHGLAAQLLPSLHAEQLLVTGDELDRTVAAVRRLLDAEEVRGQRR